MEGNFYDFANSNLPSEMEIDIRAILAKVNYADIPIISIIIFHIFVFIAALFARTHRVYRVVVFVFCMVFALLTETIGKLMKSNWEKLGFSHDYFDDDNVFLLVFFALPPIVTCIVLLSHLVGNIGDRMISSRMSRQQNENKKKQKKKKKVSKKEKKEEEEENEEEEDSNDEKEKIKTE